MKSEIEERAGRARLLHNDRSILDYILKNRQRACFQTSNEIAAALGASPSSVVRLSKKLGYANFAALKRALQSELAGGNGAALPEDVSYDKLREYGALSDGELLAAFGQSALRDFRAALAGEAEAKLAAVADLLVAARRVYLAGFRVCYGFSAALGAMLATQRPGVTVLGTGLPMVETLADLGPEDALVVISFSRYARDSVFAADMAREAGCPLIALTDSFTAPVAAGAAAVIVNNTGDLSFFDSYLGLVLNMEKIMLLVSKRNRDADQERFLKLEKYLERTGQY